ncbi:amidase [Variovorax ginsengisoli]|uniref:Amidase n=1 Tax=Variovorax ginsengisoli TaxID=363844 RepID=A0ABT8S978_9BURK|nr:amidase [Variovorax ginsengisoli]MDN8616286.1 amidase [Variovorax ginsengisoli]MDO1535456.1 amidase [Variovorax ginsengisoli]
MERGMMSVRPVASLPPELWKWDATDLAAHIKRRTISSLEVMVAFHTRIDEVNPRLNAIVQADRDAEISAALRADAELTSSVAPVGPLHGVPITIKLNADVEGQATTNGVPAYKVRVAEHDSLVVANLRRAGAIIAGRTNVPPFSHRWFTENPIHGRTLNPWSDDITSGGSSGGAAVAVASGMGAVAHGTDIAGSIRYPAYVNGVLGLRPTPGRVPALNGTVPARFAGLQLFSAQGPLARTSRDLELTLRAMAVDGQADPIWINTPLDYPDDNAACPVGLIDEIEGVALPSKIRSALDIAARALEAAGYKVDPVKVPSMRDALELWLSIVITENRLGMMADVDAMDDHVSSTSIHAMASCAPNPDLRTYVTALAKRDALRRKWQALFVRHPLLLMPTSCRLPMKWDDDLGGEEVIRKLLDDQSPLISVAALSLGGLNVPVGQDDGLPLGVQIVGAPFREILMLRAAAAIEQSAPTRRVYD